MADDEKEAEKLEDEIKDLANEYYEDEERELLEEAREAARQQLGGPDDQSEAFRKLCEEIWEGDNYRAKREAAMAQCWKDAREELEKNDDDAD